MEQWMRATGKLKKIAKKIARNFHTDFRPVKAHAISI
jgi:hypothetical protein